MPATSFFTIIGGTSTGAILTIGLTTPDLANTNNYPYDAALLLNIYI